MGRKWTDAVAPVVLGGLLLTGLVACGTPDDGSGGGPGPGASERGPVYDVEYEVSTTGLGGELYDVGFTGPEGTPLEARTQSAPVWRQRVRTRPGTPAVSLTATNKAADRWYELTCRISVDGRQVAEMSGPQACIDQFSFERLTSMSPEASPTLPPGCDLVSPDDVTAVLEGTLAMSRTVESSTTNGPSCTHSLARAGGTVTFFVDPVGGRDPRAKRVKGLKEPASFDGPARGGGELRVSLPDGNTFVLQLSLRGRVDGQEVAKELYRKARPRLLRNR